ncbi:MarR family transcriptional regulator [Agrobacterium rosae]|uniref:MarR family transcriptional regulator n=1 Tax=Agrobacterium rosae TaxID=1972867 RepID=UPI003B9DC9F5
MIEHYLSPDPIPAPAVKAVAMGRRVSFFNVVDKANMKNVVSTFDPPDVRICDGNQDFKAVSPGRLVYCIAERNLRGLRGEDLAREIMRRLAYSFHDWAAREVVGRYHRDLKRKAVAVQRRLPETMRASLRIRRFLDSNPGATVGEISRGTGIAQPNVSRSIHHWQEQGRVEILREGRLSRVFLILPGTDADVEEVIESHLDGERRSFQV